MKIKHYNYNDRILELEQSKKYIDLAIQELSDNGESFNKLSVKRKIAVAAKQLKIVIKNLK